MEVYRKLVNCRTIDSTGLCPHLCRFKSYIDENWKSHHLLRLFKTQTSSVDDDGSSDAEVDEEEELATSPPTEFDSVSFSFIMIIIKISRL